MYEMRVPGGLCIECTWCIPQEAPYQMVFAPLPHLRTHCYRHIQNDKLSDANGYGSRKGSSCSLSPPPPPPTPTSPLNPEMSNKTKVNAKNCSAGSSPPSTQLSIWVLDN